MEVAMTSVLAAQAQAWYQKYLPQVYDKIDDKAAYFQRLAEQAQEQIAQLTDALAGPDQPGETYLAKLGRLTQAQHAATEKVTREFLLSPPPPNWPDSDAPSPPTPDPSMLPETSDDWTEAMAEFNQAREELADQQRIAAMPVLPKRPTLA
jgi:hypothetical protein